MKLIYLQTLTWITVLGAVLCAMWLVSTNRASRDDPVLSWPFQSQGVDAVASQRHGAGGEPSKADSHPEQVATSPDR